MRALAAAGIAALALAGCAASPTKTLSDLLSRRPAAPAPAPAPAAAPAPETPADFRRLVNDAAESLGVRYFLQDGGWALSVESERRLRDAVLGVEAQRKARPDDPELAAHLVRARRLLGMHREALEESAGLVNRVGFGDSPRDALAASAVYAVYADEQVLAGRSNAALALYDHAVRSAERAGAAREGLYARVRRLAHLDRMSAAEPGRLADFIAEAERFYAAEPGNLYANLFLGKALARRWEETRSPETRARAAELLTLALEQIGREYPPYAASLERTLAALRGTPAATEAAPATPLVLEAPRPRDERKVEQALGKMAAKARKAEAAKPAPAPAPAAELPAAEPVPPPAEPEAGEGSAAEFSGRRLIEDDLRAVRAGTAEPEKAAPRGKPAREELIVASPVGANLRETPSREAPIVSSAVTGQRFTSKERRGPWYKVTAPDGREAWIHATVVRPEAAPELPPPAAPPEPAAAAAPALPDKPAEAAEAEKPAEAPAPIPAPTPEEKVLAARQRYRADFLEAEYKTLAVPGGARRRYLAVGAYVRNVNESERLPYLTALVELTNQRVKLGEARAHIRADGIGPGESAFVVFHVPTDLGGLDGARIVLEKAPPREETAELGAPVKPETALQLTDKSVQKAVLYLSARDKKTGRRLADDVTLWSSPEGALGGAELRLRAADGRRVRLMEKRAASADGRVFYRVQTFTGDEGWVWEGYTRLAP